MKCDLSALLVIPTIEYDCMSGYDIRGPADTLNSNNLYRNARDRFDDANVLLAFQEDELSVGATVFPSYDLFRDFIMDHWERAFWLGQKTADFYLAGIRNCTNRQQFYGPEQPPLSPTAVGLSKNATGEQFAVRGASSTVFKEEIDARLNTGYQQTGYNRTATHEMGHALARLKHPADCPNCHKGGRDANCVLNEIEYNQFGDLLPGRTKFCDKCKDSIKNITW